MKRSAIGFILLLAVIVPLCSCGKAGTEQSQDNAGDTSSEIISAVTDTPPMVTGAEDSYYGSSSFKKAYEELCGYYRDAGLSEDEINRLAVRRTFR